MMGVHIDCMPSSRFLGDDGVPPMYLRAIAAVAVSTPACAYNHHSYDVGLWKQARFGGKLRTTHDCLIRPTYDMALGIFSLLRSEVTYTAVSGVGPLRVKLN